MQQGTCYGPSVNCLITGLSAGSEASVNDVDDGFTSIQSPVIALPAGASITLSFRYYVGFMAERDERGLLPCASRRSERHSNYRSSRAARNSTNTPGVWTAQSVSLSAYAGQNVRIRFEAGDIELDQPRRSRCGRRCGIEAVAGLARLQHEAEMRAAAVQPVYRRLPAAIANFSCMMITLATRCKPPSIAMR